VLGSDTFLKCEVASGDPYELAYCEINGSSIESIAQELERIEKYSENYLNNLDVVGNASGLAWELFMNLQTSTLHKIENTFIKGYENMIQRAIMLTSRVTAEAAEGMFEIEIAPSFIQDPNANASANNVDDDDTEPQSTEGNSNATNTGNSSTS